MDISDISHEVGIFGAAAWAWTIEFLPRLTSALLVLLLGWLLATWASRAVRRLLSATHRIDRTMHPLISAIVRYGILIFVAVTVLAQLGVQTASVLAVLGAAGLAIGLALQGTLSNIAAGMMLLWLRPFGVDDYIETANVAGTVEEVGLFTTQIRTWDGIYKFVPNSQLWNVILTNYSRNPTRLVLIDFSISYEDDIEEARRVLTETATRNAGVIKEPTPAVVPLSLADSAVMLQLRAWAPTSEFWNIRWELTQAGKRDLESAGITIPFPQRVLRIVNPENQLNRPKAGNA